MKSKNRIYQLFLFIPFVAGSSLSLISGSVTIVNKDKKLIKTNNKSILDQNILSNDEISEQFRRFKKNTYKNPFVGLDQNSLLDDETLFTSLDKKLNFRAQNWLMQDDDNRKYYSSLLNSVEGNYTINYNWSTNLDESLNLTIVNAIKSVWPTYNPTDITKYFYKRAPEPSADAFHVTLYFDGYIKDFNHESCKIFSSHAHGDLTYNYKSSDKSWLVTGKDANDCWGKTMFNPLTKSIVNIGRQTVKNNGLVTNWDGESHNADFVNDIDLTNVIEKTKNNFSREELNINNKSMQLSSLFFRNNNNDEIYSYKGVWKGNHQWRLKLFDNTDNNHYKQNEWNHLYKPMGYTNLDKWFPENKNTYLTWFGNQVSTNRLDKINIDFSKLIVIDLEKTSDYTNNGLIHKESPKIYFGWNLELMNALHEYYQLANICLDIYNNRNSIIHNSNFGWQQMLKLINDIYNQKLDLNIVKKYLEQIKNSNGTDFSYPNFIPNSSNSHEVLKKFNWEYVMPHYESINDTNLNSALNEILKWKITWEYTLPNVFSNDIWCNFKSTGNNELITNINQTKIFDGNSKTFTPIIVPNYGVQETNKDNRVVVELGWINIGRNNIIIDGYYGQRKTLTTDNIYSTTKFNEENNRISLKGNILFFEFLFNPKVQSIDNVDTVSTTKALFTLDIDVSNFCGLNHNIYIDKKELEKKTIIALNLATEQEINRNPNLINEISNKFIRDESSYILPTINIDDPRWNNFEDLKKFYNLYNKANIELTDSELGLIPEEQYLATKNQLDKLGYSYINIITKVPLDYFIEPVVYDKLIKDGSIIVDEYNQSQSWYKYIIKIDCKFKPLDIKNLDKYFTIEWKPEVYTNGALGDRWTNYEIQEKQQQILDLKNRVFKLQQDFINLDKEVNLFIDTINKVDQWLTDELLKIINNNDILKNEYDTIINDFDSNINQEITNIENEYNIFNETEEWIRNGFVEKIDKTFNYLTNITNIKNLYELKLEKLRKFFKKQEFEGVKKLLTINVNKINLKLDEYIKLNNNLQEQFDKLKKETSIYYKYFNNFVNITYLDKLSIKFNLDKMKQDTNGNYLLNDKKLITNENSLNYFFNVTKEKFALEFNNLFIEKTGINVFWDKENIFSFGQNFLSQTNPKWNFRKEWSYSFNTTDNSSLINEFIINMNIISNEKKVLFNDFDNIQLKVSNLRNNEHEYRHSEEELIVEKVVASIKKSKDYTIETIKAINSLYNNNQNIFNKITQQKESLDLLQSTFIPNYNELTKNINQINNKIANYQDIVVKKEKVSPLALGLTLGSVGIAVIIAIGLFFFIRSKKKPKFKQINNNEKEAMSDFIKKQGGDE